MAALNAAPEGKAEGNEQADGGKAAGGEQEGGGNTKGENPEGGADGENKPVDIQLPTTTVFSVRVTWQNADGLNDIPENATATVQLYSQPLGAPEEEPTKVAEMTLDGTEGNGNETDAWRARFTELPLKDSKERNLVYTAKISACRAGYTPLYSDDLDYAEDGGLITLQPGFRFHITWKGTQNNQWPMDAGEQQYLPVTVKIGRRINYQAPAQEQDPSQPVGEVETLTVTDEEFGYDFMLVPTLCLPEADSKNVDWVQDEEGYCFTMGMLSRRGKVKEIEGEWEYFVSQEPISSDYRVDYFLNDELQADAADAVTGSVIRNACSLILHSLSGTVRVPHAADAHEMVASYAGRFTFRLTPQDGAPALDPATAQNDGEGKFSFSLPFALSDLPAGENTAVYRYALTQDAGDAAGIEYDASEYQITVTLTYDPAAGTLTAESRAE